MHTQSTEKIIKFGNFLPLINYFNIPGMIVVTNKYENNIAKLNHVTAPENNAFFSSNAMAKINFNYNSQVCTDLAQTYM